MTPQSARMMASAHQESSKQAGPDAGAQRTSSLRKSGAVPAPDSSNANNEAGDYFEDAADPDPLAHSNIRILESSLSAPVHEIDENYAHPTGRPLLRNRTVSPLSSGKPGPLTPAHLPASVNRGASPGPNHPGGSSSSSSKKSKIRWHFGIRSRSEPLEVMLEIYRTLKTLGFEWKEKDPEKRINMEDYKDELDYDGGVGHERVTSGDREEQKKRRRKEEEEFNKKAQALFFIETRCRLDDVIVRMDLQLYSIDSENYLVDFRNLGYRLVKQTSSKVSTPVQARVSFAGSAGGNDSEYDTAESTGVSPPKEGTGGMSTPLSSEPNSQHHALLQQAAARAGAVGGDITSHMSSATARQMWEAAAKARVQGTHHDIGGLSGAAATGQRGGSTHSGSPAGSDSMTRGGRPQYSRSHSGKSAYGAGGGGQVSSPFLFLECACRLIVELGECGFGLRDG